MAAISRIRDAWSRAKVYLSIRRRFGQWSVPSPTKVVNYDGEILPYDALQSARLRAVSDRLSQYQSTSPQYPQLNTTNQLARHGYRGNSVARRCIDILCEAAIMAKPIVVGPDGTASTTRVAQRIQRLLEFPSGRDEAVRGGVGPILWSDMFWRYIQDLYVSGNAMLEWAPGAGGDDPVELWRMAPERVYIQPSATRLIDEYVIEFDGVPYSIPRERVIHARFWDPLDEFFGVPPLYSAVRVLAIDNETIDYTKVTLQNLGVPPVALEYDLKELKEGGLSLDPFNVPTDAKAIQETRDRFWDFYGGANRGKPAIAFGYRIKLIGMDMSKLGVADLITMSESRIASVHGVPMILLNRSARESDPTRANFRQSREHFLTGTVTSLLTRLGEIFGHRLVSAFGARTPLAIRFDLSGVDVLREQRLKRAREAAQVFTSGMSSRHTCQTLAGLPTAGDDIYVPVTGASSPDRMPGDIGDGVP